MTGGGGSLSKVGIALIIVFVISLVAVFTQLFYVLWRRRVFRRQSGGAVHLSQHFSSESSFSSKELLYFFCFRAQANSVSTVPTTTYDLDSNRNESEMEVIDVDLLKIHGMFGPPRFLFTIKEEEGEHLESPAEISLCSTGKDDKTIDDSNRRRISLEECFKEYPAVAVAVEVDDQVWSDTTPFSTPCASPMYFTPPASPDHELVNDRSTGTDMVSDSRTISFVISEV